MLAGGGGGAAGAEPLCTCGGEGRALPRVGGARRGGAGRGWAGRGGARAGGVREAGARPVDAAGDGVWGPPTCRAGEREGFSSGDGPLGWKAVLRFGGPDHWG